MILVKFLHENAQCPTKKHDTDGGWDLYLTEPLRLEINQSRVVKSGIAMLLPVGWTGLIRPRSSTYMPGLETDGTIDIYTGEITIKVINRGMEAMKFAAGDRMVQLVPVWTGAGLGKEFALNLIQAKGPNDLVWLLMGKLTACDEIQVVEEFPETARGEAGLGSSGK